MVRSIDVLLNSYEAIANHLSTESHNNAKAEGLYKLLTNKHNLALMLFMRDVLGPLSTLSTWLQKNDITLGELLSMSEATKLQLMQLKTQTSKELDDLLGGASVYNSIELMGPTPSGQYHGKVVDALN